MLDLILGGGVAIAIAVYLVYALLTSAGTLDEALKRIAGETPDIDAQILCLRRLRRAPNGGQQLTVGQHPSGILRKTGEQLEFPRRQLYLRSGALHAAADSVDLDVADGHHRAMAER
jgi:hypothetical protein